MKSYPSIPNSRKALIGANCYVFYKHDGSSLRFEWSKKQRFYKYGSRTRLFDSTDKQFGEAVELFQDSLAQPLEELILDAYGKRLERFIAYAEFVGDKSFAGSHVPDDPKRLVLFDVNIHKKGFISPKDFVQLFDGDDLLTPQIVYKGILTKDFIQSVRENNVSIPLNEGVVIKGGEGHKLWMCKVKTNDYMEKLKEIKQDNWKKYWE